MSTPKTYPDQGTLKNGVKYIKYPEAVCLSFNRDVIVEKHDTFTIYKDRHFEFDVWWIPRLKYKKRVPYRSFAFIDVDLFLWNMENIPRRMVARITV